MRLFMNLPGPFGASFPVGKSTSERTRDMELSKIMDLHNANWYMDRAEDLQEQGKERRAKKYVRKAHRLFAKLDAEMGIIDNDAWERNSSRFR